MSNTLLLTMDSDSDSSSSNPNESAISLLSAEIKDLRNKIMSVKKSVTKGDKKQKKAVQDELDSLEASLSAKQEEVQRLKTVEVAAGAEDDNSVSVSKAKLKKERRKEEKAVEWEANRQAALAEVASRPDHALEESKAFTLRLTQSGFRILEIAADGHCLFSAIACQLQDAKDHWELRKMAAKYLRDHRSDFEYFIDYEAAGVEESSNRFEGYCSRIESTGLWGGQIELEALSRTLDISITVLQAQGPELKFNASQEEEGDKQEIYLSYHRFAFSLGEHYNALLPADQ